MTGSHVVRELRNPLVQQLEVEKKRLVDLQADLSLQKGRAEEWKSMYEAS